MYLVTAIIKSHALCRVRDALPDAGILGMTVTEVRGFGQQGGQVACGSYVEEAHDYLPKVKVEVAVEARALDACIEGICAVTRSGHFGDGKIFVFGLDGAMRVRTGERGVAAVRSATKAVAEMA